MDINLTAHGALLEAMPQLRTFAISLCGDADRANDLMQQTWLRAYTNLDKFKVGSSMIAWLITILRNQYYSDYRKRRREVRDTDGIYAGSLTIEPNQIANLELEDVRAALAELPDDMRRALILVAVEGASYEEAARACNCPSGTIRSRIHRARARLAARLSANRMPVLDASLAGRSSAAQTIGAHP